MPSSPTWKRIPLGLPLRHDYPQAVDGIDGGGVTTAIDVDLSTRPGSVLVRKADSLLHVVPAERPVVREIAQGYDAALDASPIAILTSGAPDSNITGLGVRGFKKLDGTEVADDWLFPEGLGLNCASAMLENSGREVRVHAPVPAYYGLPRAIKETTQDWPYISWNDDHNVPTLHELPEFVIDAPFACDGRILPPGANDIELAFPADSGNWFDSGGLRYSIGIWENPAWNDRLPMWGAEDPGGTRKGRHQCAYWAASYMYDGHQESPLTLIGKTNYIFRANLDPAGWVSTYQDFLFRGIEYAPLPERNGPNARVRKIRLYCCPCETSGFGNPLLEGKFYLANEIDVAEWDRESSATRYALPGRGFTADGSDYVAGATCVGMRLSASLDHTDAASDLPEGEGFSNRTIDTKLNSGSPVFKINDDDTYFHVESALSYRPDDAPPQGARALLLYVPASERSALAERIAKSASGELRVTMYHPFQAYTSDMSAWPVHRTFVGEELLLRPTYTQLSGLPQVCEAGVSPGRHGGFSARGRSFVYDVYDKDGARHGNRMMWSGFSPAALSTPDRFEEQNYKDFDFDIVAVGQIGTSIVVFGKDALAICHIEGAEDSWVFSDVRRGIGCVSRQSVVETPYGLFWLSNDGVRQLDRSIMIGSQDSAQVVGATDAGIISRAIFPELALLVQEWDRCRGWYDAKLNQYGIAFPIQRKAYVFDFIRRGWVEVREGLPIYSTTTGANGHAILGKFDPFGTGQSGLHEFSGSGLPCDAPEYGFRAVFGNPLQHKHWRQLILHGTAGTTVAITTGNTAATDNYALVLPAVRTKTSVGQLYDRAFDVQLTNFSEIDALFALVEEDDRVNA